MLKALRPSGRGGSSSLRHAGAGLGSGSLGGHALLAFVLIAAVVIAGCYITRLLQHDATGGARRAQARAVAELMASDIAASLSQTRSTLEILASGPDGRRLLGDPLGPEAAAWRERVTGMLPAGLEVHLLPLGWDRVESGAGEELSFADIELVRLAQRTGEATPFEVHHPGSADERIAVAVPVLQAGTVHGAVHAALATRWLESLLDHAGAGVGIDIGLRQQVPDGGRIFVAGERLGDGDPAVPVEGSLWELVYRPLPAGEGMGLRMGLWVVPLAVVALAGLILFWQVRRMRRALRSDQGAVIEVLEAALSGRPPVTPAAKLAESKPLLARIADVRLKGGGTGRGARAAGKQAGAADEKDSGPPEKPDEESIGAMFGRIAPAAAGGQAALPAEIFKAYDIRGRVDKSLTPEVMTLLGRAIGSEVYDRGQQAVILGRDCRPSSPELARALASGLRESGRDVVDLGMVPTPLVNFAARFMGTDCGVMLTASHNPTDYNGLKIVLGGEAASAEDLGRVRSRAESGDLLEGDGEYREQDLLPDYVDRVSSDVRIARPLKVAVDCGNGAAGAAATTLLKTLGCEVIELFCEPDGSFPNHHPDPSRPENLRPLIETVKREGADLGIAFDADGDRLGVVDDLGKIIWPDRLLMLFAQDVLSRQPGADVIYDVKCTRDLASHILLHGGRPLMWKSGHALMRAKLKETGALLAGELSGHIFFEERWYGFDDGLYAAARLLEILAEDRRSPAEVFGDLPESLSTPELRAPVEEGKQQELVGRMVERADFEGATLTTIDGLRAEFGDGWGLVRASNTTPDLVFRFEADDERSLEQIQARFRKLAHGVDPDLELPF